MLRGVLGDHGHAPQSASRELSFGCVCHDRAMASEDYRAINHANWESRVCHHAGSDGYQVARFRSDPGHLSDVVTFDLPRLGPIGGLDALWDAGMEITLFDEHASVPWNALGDQMEHVGGGEYALADRPERLPASYTLRARKR